MTAEATPPPISQTYRKVSPLNDPPTGGGRTSLTPNGARRRTPSKAGVTRSSEGAVEDTWLHRVGASQEGWANVRAAA